MRLCAICKKKQISGVGTFFKVPMDERRHLWSEVCRMEFTKAALVCMDHFPTSVVATAGKRRYLLASAVPSIAGCVPNVDSESYCMDTLEEETFGNSQCTQTEPFDSGHVSSDYASQTPFVYFAEKGTQTDPVILDYAVDRQLYAKKIQILETRIKELELERNKAVNAITHMRSIFTEGQIRKMMSPGDVKWKWPDISQAICIHASGPRAYNHLYKKGFPLPHISTLQRWCRKVNVNEGILTTAIEFMRHISDLESCDKLCVLAFDEMKVAETFEYDAINDSIRKPANYVQVVMARGLKKSWKQPVF